MTSGTTSAQSRCREHEDQLRERVTELMGGVFALKALRRVFVPHTLKDTAIIYLLLASAIAAACAIHVAFGPWGLLASPLLAFATGVAFNWINVQVHEASHHLLLPDKTWNDVYCNVLLGSLGFQDVETYRATHGMHHSDLHTDRDPDLWVYTTRVGSRSEVLRGLLDDLSLRTAIRRKRQVDEFFDENERRRTPAPAYTRFSKLAAQLVVLSIFVGVCGAWGVAYYVGVYLYGLLGVFPALVRIRTVVQHYEPPTTKRDDAMPFFTARTTVASFLQFVAVGARMDYHFEHHLFPNVPYYNLSKMHRRLEALGLFTSIHESTGQRLRTDDYLQSFRDLAT